MRMGLLDDAIREHLELKRQRGADPSEVAREQREALDAPVQEASAEDAASAGDTASAAPLVDPPSAPAPPVAALPADLPPDTELIAPEMSPALTGYDNSLFNTALTAGFPMQGKRQLKGEMAMVSNEVLVARSVDFGDLEAVHVAVEMTHNYLNIALEHLAGGDLQSAIEHLRDTHLKLLFRLGVSLTIDLRTSTELTLKKLGLTAVKVREIPYLDSP